MVSAPAKSMKFGEYIPREHAPDAPVHDAQFRWVGDATTGRKKVRVYLGETTKAEAAGFKFSERPSYKRPPLFGKAPARRGNRRRFPKLEDPRMTRRANGSPVMRPQAEKKLDGAFTASGDLKRPHGQGPDFPCPPEIRRSRYPRRLLRAVKRVLRL